jgi:ribosomal protein S1
MKTKITETIDSFNWEQHEAQQKRIPNKAILEKYGDVVCNHEPYALEFYEKVFLGIDAANKEASLGEKRKILDVFRVDEKEISVMLNGFIDAVLEPKAEKHFCELMNITPSGLVEWLKTDEGKSAFLQQEHYVVIDQVTPYVKGSISKGHENKIREEFYTQITECTSAYIGKIKEKNGGGFIIKVQGIDGFLPGSLAATNIVRDFDSMIGKEIPVMVEDYLKDSSTFVFSYKKYVNHVLPSKIEELDLDKKYAGTITGLAKYGIFVEFDEIFTGLIHRSKMTPEMESKFTKREFTPGEEVTFWIKEITNDKKIILTDEDPTIKRMELEDFKKNYLGSIKGGEVVAVQPFGTLIKLQKDIVGLISQKEIKSKKKSFNVGDTVMVSIDRVHQDKIFLSIPNEG